MPTPTTTTISLPTGAIGLNIDAVSSSSGDCISSEIFSTTGGFTDIRLKDNGPQAPVSVDSDGWATTDFCVYLFNNTNLPFWGKLLIEFTGKADVSAFFGLVTDYAYDPATNRSRAVLGPKPGYYGVCYLICQNTQRNSLAPVKSGITNITIHRSKSLTPTTTTKADFYDSTKLSEIFPQQDIDYLADFDFLRYMDYLNVNNEVLLTREWSQRIRPTTMFRGNQFGGGCLEHAILLANQTRTVPWFNTSDSFTVDAKTKFAQAIRWGTNGDLPYTGPPGAVTTANPRPQPVGGPEWPALDLTVVDHFKVENSNETWNYGTFPVFPRHKQRLTDAPVSSPLKYDSLAPADYNGLVNIQRVQVLETVEMSNAFRSVWGDAAMGTTCRIVLACQGTDQPDLAATGSMDQLLEYLNGIWNNGYAPGGSWQNLDPSLNGYQYGPYVPTPHPPSYYVHYLARGGYVNFALGGGNVRSCQTAAEVFAKVPNYVHDPAKSDDQNAVDAVFAAGLLPYDFQRTSKVCQMYGVRPIIYEGVGNHNDFNVTPFSLLVNTDPQMQAVTTALIDTCHDSGTAFCHYDSDRGNWKVYDVITETPKPRALGYRARMQRRGNGRTPQLTVTNLASFSNPRNLQNQNPGWLAPLDRYYAATATPVEFSIQGRNNGTLAGPSFEILLDGVRVGTGRLPTASLDLVQEARVRVPFTFPAGVHSLALRTIQPLYQSYGSTLDLAVPPTPAFVDAATPPDALAGLADNATLGTGWVQTQGSAAFVASSSRGGVHVALGSAGFSPYAVHRTVGSTTAQMAVQAVFTLAGDSIDRWVQLTSGDGVHSVLFGIHYDQPYIHVDAGSLNVGAKLLGTATAGTCLLRIEWHDTTAAFFCNGFEIFRLSVPAASVGTVAGFGLNATRVADLTSTTLVSQFRASELVAATVPPPPVVEAPTGSSGVARLLRLLRRVM